MSATDLPYAHGGPGLRGVLRQTPEDFVVDEDLGFTPDGDGEHVLVRVEKRGANTDWVARELARHAGISADVVSYAGIKDRHAVARQTFSLQVPGKREIDWTTFASPEVRILDATRHGRKLRRGALQGNGFRIVLRRIEGDRTAAEAALVRIAARGVPNYFGEQRFGRDAGNVERARRMFAGARMTRQQRSMLLSAARSEMFNAVLAARVAAGTWDEALDGEVWMLDGSHSIFGPVAPTPEIAARLAEGDIHPTAPMWGRGELRSEGDARAIESGALAPYAELRDGLERAGLEQERRSTRLTVGDCRWQWLDAALEVEFRLPAGSYATAVLREVATWTDASAVAAMQE